MVVRAWESSHRTRDNKELKERRQKWEATLQFCAVAREDSDISFLTFHTKYWVKHGTESTHLKIHLTLLETINIFQSLQAIQWSSPDLTMLTLSWLELPQSRSINQLKYNHTEFKSLMLDAYRAANGSAPCYINTLLVSYTRARPLRSANKRSLKIPSSRGLRSQTSLFSFAEALQ